MALVSQGQRDERLQCEYLRLKCDRGMLDDPYDYENIIFESLEAGMPMKAFAVLTQGKERSIFSKDRFERMRKALNLHEGDEQGRLQHALNRAHSDNTGENEALVARIYLDERANAEAAAYAQRALAKGTLRDPDVVRLNLGIAYLRNGQSRLAKNAFNAVSSQSQLAQLAQLWRLHAEEQGLRPSEMKARDVG